MIWISVRAIVRFHDRRPPCLQIVRALSNHDINFGKVHCGLVMINDPSGQRAAKVIMLGDSSVGKTSIVVQFFRSEFDAASEPTIGAAYVSKAMQTKSGIISLHIWDTAGQERFKSVIPMYMRGCSAVILVCATDSLDSVQSLDNWLTITRDTVANIENLYLVLNKTDLAGSFDSVLAETWAKAHDCKYFKTSALHRETIDPLFQDIAETIAAVAVPLRPLTQPLKQPEENSSNTCCK
jgi:small GTP-binding protein